MSTFITRFEEDKFCSNKVVVVVTCVDFAVRISSTAVYVSSALSLQRSRVFLIAFQRNCALGFMGHMTKTKHI